jgi:hypothetical protein
LYLHTHTPIMCITAKLTEPNFYWKKVETDMCIGTATKKWMY